MPPEVPSIRIFDTMNLRMTGRVVHEDQNRVVLENIAAASVVEKKKEDGTVEYALRLDPILLIGRRYSLYKSAIRGESWLTEPSVLAAYEAFAAKMEVPNGNS